MADRVHPNRKGPSGKTLKALGIMVGAVGIEPTTPAKKRRLGEVPNTNLRVGIELVGMALLIAAIVLQNDLKRLIAEDPVPNFFIPLWEVVAYGVALIWRRKTVT